MKLFKKLLMIAFVAAMVSPLTGCSVGRTKEENNRTLRRVADYDGRMLVDDTALFFQTNRPFRGSRWVIE